MWNAQTDPLGISLKSRAADQQRTFRSTHLGQSFGPLHDPQWDGLFQALQEQGVDNLADNSVGAHRTTQRPAMWAGPTSPTQFTPMAGATSPQMSAMGPTPGKSSLGTSAGIGMPQDRFEARPQGWEAYQQNTGQGPAPLDTTQLGYNPSRKIGTPPNPALQGLQAALRGRR